MNKITVEKIMGDPRPPFQDYPERAFALVGDGCTALELIDRVGMNIGGMAFCAGHEVIFEASDCTLLLTDYDILPASVIDSAIDRIIERAKRNGAQDGPWLTLKSTRRNATLIGVDTAQAKLLSVYPEPPYPMNWHGYSIPKNIDDHYKRLHILEKQAEEAERLAQLADFRAAIEGYGP